MYYEFFDIDGQRDTGTHEFHYSVWPYEDAVDEHALTTAGYAYNLPSPIDPPFTVTGDVVVTAWKPAEAGDGWILRLQETLGIGTQVGMLFDRPRTITRTDLLERPLDAPTTAAGFSFFVNKHGLITVHIR
jgi:alpha-mannosidase